MSTIRLTVGIPTYNRAGDLSIAIESVLAQATNRLRDQLEILISDNASTDTTSVVIDEFQTRYPGVVNRRNNIKNIGFSRNVDAVIRHAKGEYVLLLSDDDALDEGALDRLFDIIDLHKDVGVVFLSETPYDSALRAPLAPPCGHKAKKGDILYRPGIDYVRQNHIFPPFLVSGYVFRREAWFKADPTDFFDTICVHALAALRICGHYSAYVSFASSIRYRTENSTNENRWIDELYPFKFHLDLLVGCKGLKSLYPARSHRYLHQQALRSVAYHIMDLKVSSGRIPVGLLCKRLKELADKSDPLYWLNLILLQLPPWIVRILFKVSVRWRHV